MQKNQILVINSRPILTYVLEGYLKEEGYDVLSTDRGHDALGLVVNKTPQLIILDLELPDIDGFELCRRLRKITTVPIISISNKNDDKDKLLSLEFGADNYLTSPYNPLELIARVKATFRRMEYDTNLSYNRQGAVNIFSSDGLEINIANYQVTYLGENIDLTAKEFQLLCFLVKYTNRVFSKDQLLSSIWSKSYNNNTNTVTVHIQNLRKKLAKVGLTNRIVSLRGVGYKYRLEC